MSDHEDSQGDKDTSVLGRINKRARRARTTGFLLIVLISTVVAAAVVSFLSINYKSLSDEVNTLRIDNTALTQNYNALLENQSNVTRISEEAIATFDDAEDDLSSWIDQVRSAANTPIPNDASSVFNKSQEVQQEVLVGLGEIDGLVSQISEALGSIETLTPPETALRDVSQTRAQSEDIDTYLLRYQIGDSIIRLGAVFIAVFLVQVLSHFAKYQFRIADYYEALSLAYEMTDGQLDKMSQLLTSMMPTHIGFEKLPITVADKSLDLARDALGKSK